MFPIKSLEDLERLSKEMKWQYFEKLVGWIFEQNDFSVEVSRVFVYPEGKRQYDVIAKRFGKTFLIECKKWKRSNVSAVRKAVEDHIEKAGLYAINQKEEVIPMVVTLLQENIKEHECVPIVPVDKLNTFINQRELFD